MWQFVPRVHLAMNGELTMLKAVKDSKMVSLLVEYLVSCDRATARELCLAFIRSEAPSAEHNGGIAIIRAENMSNQWVENDIL